MPVFYRKTPPFFPASLSLDEGSTLRYEDHLFPFTRSGVRLVNSKVGLDSWSSKRFEALKRCVPNP